jgi:hypothetical protein
MQIIKIEKSPIKHKRFRVFLDNKKHYDFGLDTGDTFIDHHNYIKRNAYIARHFANTLEKNLIINHVPSPALFSMYLLWGKYPDLQQNIDLLNSIFRKKYI